VPRFWAEHEIHDTFHLCLLPDKNLCGSPATPITLYVPSYFPRPSSPLGGGGANLQTGQHNPDSRKATVLSAPAPIAPTVRTPEVQMIEVERL